MFSVTHETGVAGWFSCNPNKVAIIPIIFGTYLLEELPQSLSFSSRVRGRYGNMITAVSVGNIWTWVKPCYTIY